MKTKQKTQNKIHFLDLITCCHRKKNISILNFSKAPSSPLKILFRIS